jgi:hypothetical protein
MHVRPAHKPQGKKPIGHKRNTCERARKLCLAASIAMIGRARDFNGRYVLALFFFLLFLFIYFY